MHYTTSVPYYGIHLMFFGVPKYGIHLQFTIIEKTSARIVIQIGVRGVLKTHVNMVESF